MAHQDGAVIILVLGAFKERERHLKAQMCGPCPLRWNSPILPARKGQQMWAFQPPDLWAKTFFLYKVT